MVTFGDSYPYIDEEYIEKLEGYLKEFESLSNPNSKIIYTVPMIVDREQRIKFLKGKLLQGVYSCYMEVHDGSGWPEYRPVFKEILKVINKTW
jgi:hypothetical protein